MLLCGLFFASSLSLVFGFSQHYAMSVLARFAIGLFAPIGVVTKTCVSEVCPEDKQTLGMSLYSMVWLSSSAVGSIVGGVLVDPKGTGLVKSGVLADYPFLLPNLVTVLSGAIAFTGILLWLDETHGKKIDQVSATHSSLLASQLQLESRHLTFRDLLKDKVIMLAVVLYGVNSFNSTAYFELFPLWCWAEKSDGGLEFNPLEIGYALAGSNLLLVIFQQWLFRKIVARKGYLWTVLCGSLAMAPTMFVIPWIAYAKNTLGIWIYIIGISMLWYFLSFQVLTSQFVITNNTVMKPERGRLNGICMMAGSFARAIAPLLVGILFARTATSGLPFPLDYTFCFNFIAVLCLVMWFFSRYLPPSIQHTKESILREQKAGELKAASSSLP